ISTNNLKRINANKIISLVRDCVERNGFRINKEKTKVMYRNQRQMVTGIVVNEGLNLPKKNVDALKAT
ncbi:RNA-dependent RNA polymerase family protein, partial [Vibrio parahaemolyticus]